MVVKMNMRYLGNDVHRDDYGQKTQKGGQSHTMMSFFGRMMKLPFEAFVYGLEMFVQTMQGLQQIAYQGIDTMADGITQVCVEPADSDVINNGVIHDAIGDSAEPLPQTTHKENMKMADQDLGGKDLKLVRYKILFVKRDYEHAFDEQEELVHEDTNATGFTAWKTAQFIQELQKRKTMVPEKWKQYPPSGHHPPYREEDILLGLPDEDKKYLRVYFEVLDRYPREPLEYEEQQLEILRGIRDDLGGIRRGVGPSN